MKKHFGKEDENELQSKFFDRGKLEYGSPCQFSESIDIILCFSYS